jgi:SAM-dependent methyltransferase
MALAELESLAEFLACPVCHYSLDEGASGVSCGSCGRHYTITDGVLDFLPDPVPDNDVAEHWPLWEQLEHNASIAYDNDPQGNLSITPRDDYAAFAEFARLDGIVLDVGCGPQKFPWYGSSVRGTLIGIDPLLGRVPRGFAFVRGVAEYLPFREEAFDRVLFATSIDHVLVPARALSEAGRVAKRGGEICIWFGEGSASTAKPVSRSNPWYDALEVPAGAVDRFHARRFTVDVIRGLIADAGLEISELERLDGTPSVFLRVRRG